MAHPSPKGPVMRLPMHVIFAAASLCFVASHARALPLAAGRGVTVDSEDPPFVMPPGTKLAEKTIPFTLTYPIPAGREAAGDTTADATLVSSVYRHADTGRLFFVYALDVEDILFFPPDRFGQPTRELSQLTVAGFTSSATDVTGDTSPGASFQVSRSADGSTLTTFTGEGLGGPPLLVVQTDATAYDALGRSRSCGPGGPDPSGQNGTRVVVT